MLFISSQAGIQLLNVFVTLMLFPSSFNYDTDTVAFGPFSAGSTTRTR